MKPLSIALLLFILFATPAAAQDAPAPGDLVPRNGTLAYVTSDRPDVVYRLFGQDAQGQWKLRSFAESMAQREFDDPESEEAQGARTILDYVFDGYEAVAGVELAIIDVTTEGPKYLLNLRTKDGESIDIEPEFLTEQVEPEAREFLGVRYLLYEPVAERESSEARPVNPVASLQRFYVASTDTGVIVSNFETTMRGAIEKLSSGDYSESFSGREEFQSWLEEREPHDLSIFMIGREIQNAIERLLPSEEQSGMDAEGVFRELNEWIQFREYRYIALNFDYDAAARGMTISASFKTRRPTRLLENLAIEPAEFKLLQYLPEGTIMRAGLQLGDAKQTFENLKALANDAEGWLEEIQGPAGGTPPEMPPTPEDEPRTIDPAEILKRLGNAQDAEGSEEEPGEIDRALEELGDMLQEYGTSLDEILNVLGTEVILFVSPDEEAARQNAYGSVDVDDIFGSGRVGLIIGLEDAEKARAIIDTAREKDPQGAFRDFAEVEYQGQTLQVSGENPFGYCFTEDALLIAAAMAPGEDMADSVVANLRGMIDATTSTGTGDRSFIGNGSKFMEFDLGAVTRIRGRLNEDLSRRLDRDTEPPIGADPFDAATDVTFALRTREFADGLDFAVRIAGLPDFGQFLDGDSAMTGNDGKRTAYYYAQNNLRSLGTALHTRVAADEAIDLDAMLEAEAIRPGLLQVPLDSRWKGDVADLGWTTLDQIERDEEGNLPEWVDEAAVAMIEANEEAGFRSIKLADGDLAEWISGYRSGFIVAYQEKAETAGGHMVLYADGQAGWLHSDVLEDALALNAEGKPVPSGDEWDAPMPEDGSGEGSDESE